MIRIQEGKVFSLKFIPEDSHRNEKLMRGIPESVVRCESSAGNDAVHMHMIADLLVPCVQHLDDPQSCAKILLICREFQERVRTAFGEEMVQKDLITADEWV